MGLLQRWDRHNQEVADRTNRAYLDHYRRTGRWLDQEHSANVGRCIGVWALFELAGARAALVLIVLGWVGAMALRRWRFRWQDAGLLAVYSTVAWVGWLPLTLTLLAALVGIALLRRRVARRVSPASGFS